MSKKTKKITPIKKVVKPSKSKPSSKNLKKENPAKTKPGKVAAKKVAAKTIVKKKTNNAKVAKPIKKETDKKGTAKKAIDIKKKKVEVISPAKKTAPKKVEVAKKKEVKEKQPKLKDKKEAKEPKKGASKEPDFDDDMFDQEPVPSKSKKRRKKKKNKVDEDEPEILHDELVEQLIRSTKKLRNQPKVPKILKTFTNPMASLTVAVPVGNNKKASSVPHKEPKGKFSVEYVMRTSAVILYEFLTTPSGLSEWFADDVNIHDGVFTFFWDGSAQKAKLLGFKEEDYIRMQWLDKQEGSYFEFKIQKDVLTGDVSLIVTDFADEASDLETSKRLWDTEVDKLLHIIGSY